MYMQADIPHFSVGDKVSVSISEERLAQLVKKQKEFGELYSMVCCQVYVCIIYISVSHSRSHILSSFMGRPVVFMRYLAVV